MYSKIKQFLNMVPKDLTSANEIYNFARNAYKQVMGFFPDGLDNVFLKRGSAEMQDVRQKVVNFPPGGKDKTDFFTTRPDPRVKQPEGAKMDIQRANENLAGGANYAEGDTKYNADILGEELARVRGFIKEGQDSTDMDPREYSKLYDEAYSYLTQLRFLNRPPKKEGIKSIDLAKELEELTNKNLKERGLGEIKLGDKLPSPKNKKPDVDPKLQDFEDNKQMFLDFGNRIETDAEMIARMNKQNKDSVKRLKEKKEKDLADKLKDYDGDPDAMADGGRIGFDKGGEAGFAGDPMEGEQYVISDIPGNPQVPMGQFGPLNVGIFGGGSYGKNEIVPGVDMATTNQNYGIVGQFPIGNTGFTLGANYMKSRANERFTGDAIPGQTFKNVPTDSDRFNIGINYTKTFKDGGRIGFKEGTPKNPGRRNFMKMIAGLASLPVVGKLFKGAKVAEKVVQLKNTATTMPAWFPQFVERFISKGVGKKVDADIMEFKNPDLPGVTLSKTDDGQVLVEGKNAYGEIYEIDYKPPGFELIDETTGKAVKIPGEFKASDTRFRQVGPEMDDVDADYETVENLDEILGGNSTKLEGFAKGTNKEKYTKGAKAVDEADQASQYYQQDRADFNKGPEIDPTDYIDETQDFAKGGLAYMLGE